MTETKERVAVLGAGRFGQVAAGLLSSSGATVTMWARRPEALDAAKRAIPAIETSSDMQEATESADLVLFAVPAVAVAEVARAYGDYARGDQIVLHACRGVAEGFRLPHQLIRSVTCVRKIGGLGGPLHSHDLKSGRVMATVLASRFDETFSLVKRLTKNTPLKIHTSRDLIGVEIAGAISNVSALAAGMADALDLGETARGLLLAHGLSEAERIGLVFGAFPETFAGLAGVGDLIPRSVSSTDRCRTLGAQLAEGIPLSDALAALDGHVEGVLTAKEAQRVARAEGLELPLIEATVSVLDGSQPAKAALETVLQIDLDDLIVARRRGVRA